MVKIKGGDRKIPQGIGEVIWRNPSMFIPSNPLIGNGGIVVKLGSVCFFVWV